MSRNAQTKRSFARLAGAVFCLCLLAQPRAYAQSNSLAPATNGLSRARVVIVDDPEATYDLQPVPDRIQSMVDRGVTNLTGKATPAAAWKSLVSPDDTVGIKVYSTPGPNSGTRPAVAAAVVRGLLDAGIPTNHIILWDKRSVDLRLAGFYDFQDRFGIRVRGAEEAGYDDKTFYPSPLLGSSGLGDTEAGDTNGLGNRNSRVSKLVSQQLTKMINITPMMHHNMAGVYGNLFSLTMGSVDNAVRFERSPAEFDKAAAEIYAMPVFGDRVAGEKVVLSITDALICQYGGQQHALLHYSTNLNQLRFSRDPVALDYLSLDEINRQSALAGMPASKTNLDLLHNATALEIGVSDPRRIDILKVP